MTLLRSIVSGADARRYVLSGALVLPLLVSVGCSDNPIDPDPIQTSATLQVLGQGVVAERYTGEVWVRGNVAYTTTWASRLAPGNAVKIWDVSGGGAPVLVDSLIIPGAGTLGDIETSDDGSLLVVATEYSGGSIAIYDRADPIKPVLLSRYSTLNTNPGVHTAEVERVNGRLYAFLAVNPTPSSPARLVIVDITDPRAPFEVFSAAMGNPFVHDVFVRDGILFTALWNEGLSIWDLGGAGSGSPSAPRFISNVKTSGGKVHNVWWYHSSDGARRYAFVGEEGPAGGLMSSSGDIHVVDVSDLANPQEVAFYHIPGAGTHNFSVDETRGILYAAYYNGGVRALDVTGDLSSCTPAQRVGTRCDLGLMGRELATGLLNQGMSVFIWGVQLVGDKLYASDMLNGLWVLREFTPVD